MADQYAGWLILNTVTFFLVLFLMAVQLTAMSARAARQYVLMTAALLGLVTLRTVGAFFEGSEGGLFVLTRICTWAVFALEPLGLLAALHYVDCFVPNEGDKDRGVFILIMRVYAALNFIVVTASVLLKLDWFYSYQEHTFVRGPFYMHHALLHSAACLLIGVYVFWYRYRVSRVHKGALFALPLLTLLGGYLQLRYPGLAAGCTGAAFGCLNLLVFVQRNDSNLDYLTGVMNRRGLEAVMVREFEAVDRLGTFAAVMVDVDFFKEINDNYSHQQGDEVLTEVAGLLRRGGGNDAEIGRYGGDEFVMIVHVIDPRLLEEIVERVREGLKELNASGRYPFEISLSLGYAVCDPAKTPTLAEFQKLVDSLMYEEKVKHHLEKGIAVR